MADDIAKVLFGDQHDPLAELAPYDADTLERSQALPLTPTLRGSLDVFLKAALSLRMDAAKHYTLTFKPGMLERASRLMRAHDGSQHAIAINQRGRIIGQGRLKPVSGTGVLSSAVAVWQVMSVVTAQLHLTEIHERLAQIERSVNAVRAWLEADKIATLLNAQHYVAEVRDAFATRSLTEQDVAGFQHQLERLWLDCGQVEMTLQLVLESQPEQFQQLELGSVWGLDGQVVTAKEAIGQYQRLAQAYLLAVQTRALLTCARAALPLSQELTAQRLQQLREAVQLHQAREQAFFAVAETHVRQKLGAMFHVGTDDDVYREKVLSAAALAKFTLSETAIDVEANINAIEQRYATQRLIAERHCTLVLTLDEHGDLAEVSRLRKA